MMGIKADWVLVTEKPFTEDVKKDIEDHGFRVLKVFECKDGTVIVVKFEPQKIWEKELR